MIDIWRLITMSEVVLELKNISKVFGKQKVLDNSHLTIRKGDIY